MPAAINYPHLIKIKVFPKAFFFYEEDLSLITISNVSPHFTEWKMTTKT